MHKIAEPLLQEQQHPGGDDGAGVTSPTGMPDTNGAPGKASSDAAVAASGAAVHDDAGNAAAPGGTQAADETAEGKLPVVTQQVAPQQQPARQASGEAALAAAVAGVFAPLGPLCA
jgi:hypothetical protein